MMTTTTWPTLLDRRCARRREKIKKGLDKCHRKSVLSSAEGFKASRRFKIQGSRVQRELPRFENFRNVERFKVVENREMLVLARRPRNQERRGEPLTCPAGAAILHTPGRRGPRTPPHKHRPGRSSRQCRFALG